MSTQCIPHASFVNVYPSNIASQYHIHCQKTRTPRRTRPCCWLNTGLSVAQLLIQSIHHSHKILSKKSIFQHVPEEHTATETRRPSSIGSRASSPRGYVYMFTCQICFAVHVISRSLWYFPRSRVIEMPSVSGDNLQVKPAPREKPAHQERFNIIWT